MLKPLETVELFESQPEQTFKAGEIIFREGEQGKVMYGIVEGEVERFSPNN